MNFTCCFECGDRHPGCHSTCGKYAVAKAVAKMRYENGRAAIQAERNKGKETRAYINEHYDSQRRK